MVSGCGCRLHHIDLQLYRLCCSYAPVCSLPNSGLVFVPYEVSVTNVACAPDLGCVCWHERALQSFATVVLSNTMLALLIANRPGKASMLISDPETQDTCRQISAVAHCLCHFFHPLSDGSLMFFNVLCINGCFMLLLGLTPRRMYCSAVIIHTIAVFLSNQLKWKIDTSVG